MPKHVNHLEVPCAFDDIVAIADESKVVVGSSIVVVDLENELESGGVIVGLALEGVGRSLEQVYVSTGEVVDQVQIGRRCLLKSPVQSC